jgi:hypothetical protein
MKIYLIKTFGYGLIPLPFLSLPVFSRGRPEEGMMSDDTGLEPSLKKKFN